MSLQVGDRLGLYEIKALLGVGGMGEVYRAIDAELGREVAIKVLPQALASDADRLARFEREARTLAALNHPNVATLYGLERGGSSSALVMELVEGPTLEQRLGDGPLPLDEALDIAGQIASALEAAHEQGIVHRDLKPPNVKVRADGAVKVLDFGLAKATEPLEGSSPSLTTAPTRADLGSTRAGVVLGTAPYMSPEQARGKPVDRRTDIWAFGCVLYEMLTGRRAFAGATASDVLAEVLRDEPDWTALAPDLPPPILRLLRRCLERDPSRRLRHVGDARLELSDAIDGATEVETAQGRPRADGLRLPLVAAVSLVLGGLLAVLFSSRGREPVAGSQPVVVRVPIEADRFFPSYGMENLAISRDGRLIAYPASTDQGIAIRLRPLDSVQTRTLENAGLSLGAFFSPDGSSLGYLDRWSGSLRRVPVSGGLATTICEVGPELLGASWGDDDSIVFASSDRETGLLRVAAEGGEPEVLTRPDLAAGELDHAWPQILPGGDAVLYTILSEAPEKPRIAALSLRDGTVRAVLSEGSYARYASSGHLVYAKGSQLWAVAFDPRRLVPIGRAAPIVEGVFSQPGAASGFALAENGSLVFLPTGTTEMRTMGWVDRRGQMIEEIVSAPIWGVPRLSPDGSQIAVGQFEEKGGDVIWIYDLRRGGGTKLTLGRSDRWPVWLSDDTLAFSSARVGGTLDMYTRSLSRNQDELLLADSALLMPTSSRGEVLLFSRVGGADSRVDVETLVDGERTPILDSAAEENSAQLSPDGRWLAYLSDRTGRSEIYVQSFPEGDRVVPVSTGGGTEPMWSPDGRELFYRSGNEMMAVSVTGPTLEVGPPTLLFETPYEESPIRTAAANYDVSPDGQRFLMIRGDETAGSAKVMLVVNWTQELKRLLPGE